MSHNVAAPVGSPRDCRSRRNRVPASPASLPDFDPEAWLFRTPVDDEVLRAISALPLEHRAVLGLVDVEGLRYGDAAALLSIPVTTVKSRLLRARKLLQAELREYAVRIGWIPEAQRAAGLS